MNDSPKLDPKELGVRLEGSDVPVIVRDRMPDPHAHPAFAQFRKTPLTLAARMDGPFAVQTSEGLLTCQDGWLAIDQRGWPYPIDADEFDLIYERVHSRAHPGPPTGEPARRERRSVARWSEPFQGRDGQWYFHLRAANGEIVAQSEGYTRRADAYRGVEAAKRAAAQAAAP
jgi:uncharacterized protein YegP (UPF0339 family)